MKPINPKWDMLRDERVEPPTPFQVRYASTLSARPEGYGIGSLPSLYPPVTKQNLKIEFPKIKERIKDIFENKLNIHPEHISPYINPEDGEEKIIVTVPLGNVDDPLEAILTIKRKLRKIDRELANEIVVLPSD